MFRESIVVTLLALVSAAQPLPPASQTKFSITGTAIDSVHSSPLPNVEVSMFQREALLQSTTTDLNGRFKFVGLNPGKYGLIGRGTGYQQQSYEQHFVFSTGIVVGPGIESDNLIFRLKPDALISGTVTDEFNEPVRAAEIYLFMSGTAQGAVLPLQKYETSDTGSFYFSSLREGKYYVVVVAHPWYAHNPPDSSQTSSASDKTGDQQEVSNGPSSDAHGKLDVAFPTTYYANATDPGHATPISLKPGDHVALEFHLAAVPAIRLKTGGVPAFENATAPLKLSEQIFGFSRLVATRPINQDGAELTGLAPGHYVLEFPPQGTTPLVQQPLDLSTDTEIAPGEGSRLASSVSGTVQLGSEGICLRCRVRLIHLPSYQIFDAQSGPKGFQVEGGVRPGRYLVLLGKEQGYIMKTISAVGAVVKGTELEIQAGNEIQMTIVMTKDYGTIGGFALRDGKPASAVAIYLVPDNPADNFSLFRSDQSDSDGSFELGDVVPGSYTLIAVAEGWNFDTTNPDSFPPYLAGGVKVQIRAGEHPQFKLNVQTKAEPSK
jgi:hypothetical protein